MTFVVMNIYHFMNNGELIELIATRKPVYLLWAAKTNGWELPIIKLFCLFVNKSPKTTLP
jgi:hypothetical protein